VQLFSRIQNLAVFLKFYFNFGRLADDSTSIALSRHVFGVPSLASPA